MGRRSEHSREELRSMALVSARKLLEEQGLEGLSARKVASGMGYTVGSLYMVFENFDALLVEVNGETLDELHGVLEQAGNAAASPRDRLAAMADAYIDFAFSHPQRWRLIFELRLPRGVKIPAMVQDRIDALFGLATRSLARLLPSAGEVELQRMATTLWSGIHGLCILALTDKLYLNGEQPVHALTSFFVTHYLDGLVGSAD